MEATYEEHVIQSFGRKDPDRDRWFLTITISEFGGTNPDIHQFDGPPEGFATQQEAEIWGIEFGKNWIDEGKPGHSPR